MGYGLFVFLQLLTFTGNLKYFTGYIVYSGKMHKRHSFPFPIGSLHPVFLAVFLLSCESNPYPDTESLQSIRQVQDHITRPPVSINIKNGVEFVEGKQNFIPIMEAQVPGGDPLIVLKNIPPFTNIENKMYVDDSDPENLKIVWTPDYLAANSVNYISKDYKTYDIIVEVSSQSNPGLVGAREVYLHVKNARKNFRIEGPSLLEIQEGESKRLPFKIINDEFPNAPHVVSHSLIAANTIFNNYVNQVEIEIDPEDPLKFYLNVNFLPFDFLRFNDIVKYNQYLSTKGHSVINPFICHQTSCTLRTKISIHVRDPDYRLTSLHLSVVVKDMRKPPVVIAPSRIKLEKNVRFPIIAFDPNREYRPRIHLHSIIGNMPGGDLRCHDLDSNGTRKENSRKDYFCGNLSTGDIPPTEADESPDETFNRIINVEWLNIPENLLANENALTWNFEICTIGNQRINKNKNEILFNNCKIHTVILENDNFVPPPGPVFEDVTREPILYTKKNHTVEIPLPISESDDKSLPPYSVSVKALITKKSDDGTTLPQNINARWDVDNETIVFKSPNSYAKYELEFTILALSRFGIESTDNFSIDFETIPPELFITTNDLVGDTDTDKKLDYLAFNIAKDIFIHTPHLDRLPPVIRQTLEEMGVVFNKNILNKEDLSKREIYFETSKTRISSKVFLSDIGENEIAPTLVYYDKGKRTNPLSICEEIFSIGKKPEDNINSLKSSLPVAIRCMIITDPERKTPPSDFQRGHDKAHGIVFVIMGFEYDKLQAADTSDQSIVENWKKHLFSP